MSNPTTNCDNVFLADDKNGQHLTGCAYIHCSKSPKISFLILTWLHSPLLKRVLYHILKANLWYLSYLDRKVTAVFYIFSNNHNIQ